MILGDFPEWKESQTGQRSDMSCMESNEGLAKL